MTQIYTQAEKLLIWLGTDDNDVAVKFIARLAMFSQSQEPHEGIIVKPRIHLAEWQALRRYLGASWFRRMWVVQELVLGLQMDGPSATEVFLGPHTLLWTELIRCCGWIRDNYTTLLPGSTPTINTYAIRRSIDRVLSSIIWQHKQL